jgi:hypothetical protein
MTFTLIINIAGQEQASAAPIFHTIEEVRAALTGALLYHLELMRVQLQASHPIVYMVHLSVADLNERSTAEIEHQGYRASIPADSACRVLPVSFYILPIKAPHLP